MSLIVTIFYVRIDKKKKLLVTTFLQALGIPRDQIVSLFYKFDEIQYAHSTFYQKLDDGVQGHVLSSMTELANEDLFVGKRLTKELIKQLAKAGVSRLELVSQALVNRTIGADIIDPKTGEIIVEQGIAVF